MKHKFKSYAFCLGVCMAVVALVVSVGNCFGFKVDEIALTSVITAILGVFVALGVIEKEQEENTLEVDKTLDESEEIGTCPEEKNIKEE